MQIKRIKGLILVVLLICAMGIFCACENPLNKTQNSAESTNDVLPNDSLPSNVSYVIVRAVETEQAEAQVCTKLNDMLGVERVCGKRRQGDGFRR